MTTLKSSCTVTDNYVLMKRQTEQDPYWMSPPFEYLRLTAWRDFRKLGTPLAGFYSAGIAWRNLALIVLNQGSALTVAGKLDRQQAGGQYEVTGHVIGCSHAQTYRL